LTRKSEADLGLLFATKKDASKKTLQVQQLHLYSIASPGMRRWPDNTQDLGAALAWAEPVNMKPGWAQLQKGFFQAPGGNGQTAGNHTPATQLTQWLSVHFMPVSLASAPFTVVQWLCLW
jgi:hypothetical protein